MSLFANLNTDGLEQTKDVLGGFQVYESGIYTGKIKAAYAGESSGGAMSITLVLDMGSGSSYNETIYITNKKKENFFLNPQDKSKKVPLPGFTIIEDLCLVTTDKTLSEQDTEEKIIKLYDRDEKKEVPTKVQMLVDLLDQPFLIAIQKSLENKQVKDESSGEYVPTEETVERNNIEKIFHVDTQMTVVELRNEETAPVFHDAWEKKNKGVVRNKVKPVVGGGKSGTPKPASAQAGAAAPVKKSGLFNNKK